MSEEKSLWKEYKKSLGEARPWHLLSKENYVSDPVALKRFDICLSCEFITPRTHQCKKCKCLMKNKVKLKQAECPIGKWGKEKKAE